MSGNSNVGGLVGYNSGLSTIEFCYSNCEVSGVKSVGGFVDWNGNSGSIIRNSYSNTNITRQSGSTYGDIGGFVGLISYGTISYS